MYAHEEQKFEVRIEAGMALSLGYPQAGSGSLWWDTQAWYLHRVTRRFTKPALRADVQRPGKIEFRDSVEGSACKPGLPKFIVRAQEQREVMTPFHKL